MRGRESLRAIIEKEIKSYFCTIRGYIFIGVFLLVTGYFFVNYNVFGKNSDVGTILENTVIFFVLLTPVLTMGLFAGERHSGTDVTYLCSPLKKYKVVLGKYIAALLVFFCAVALNSLTAFVMVALRGQTFGEVFATYVGFALVGAVFISVGMFVSALTENQIVAAVISFCVCFTLYISDWILNLQSGVWAKVIAFPSHYDKFLAGIFDVQAVLYFLSMAAMFTLLTVLRIRRTETDGVKKRERATVCICVVLSFFLFNFCMEKLSAKVPMTFDMSKNAVFTLSDETVNYLKKMDGNVTMYYLAETGKENTYVTEVLERYVRQTDKVTLKTVDLIKNPSFAARYCTDGGSIAKGTVVVESGKRFTTVEPELSFHIKKNNGNVSRELGFSLESKLTQAVDYVLGDKSTNVVWLTAHGENGYEKAAEVLQSENMQNLYEKDVGLAAEKADLIIAFSPSNDISVDECADLKDYLENGGKMLIALNPGYDAKNFKSLTASYGMRVQDDVLTTDSVFDVIRGNRTYLVAYPTAHKITEGIAGVRNLLFPVTSSVTVSDDTDCEVTRLAVSDVKTAAREIRQDTLSEKLSTGVFTLAAISEKPNGSKLLLCGSSQFAAPKDSTLGDVLSADNYSNREFLVSSVKYLTGSKDTVSVSPKSIMSRSLNLNLGTQIAFTALFGVLLPLSVFVLAFIVFKRRRNR